jgi:hypothetical protein
LAAWKITMKIAIYTLRKFERNKKNIAKNGPKCSELIYVYEGI